MKDACSEGKAQETIGSSLLPLPVILMTVFIDTTGFGIVILLLPFYAVAFQEGPAALGILVASFSLMQFIFSPILGRMSDKLGRRPVLLLSILASMVSFTLLALARSFLMLLLSRMIAGMATETAVAQAYIADATTTEERAKGIGRMSAAQAAGFAIGPAIGGFASLYGLWAPGLIAASLAFLNFLFVFFFLPESSRRTVLGVRTSFETHRGDLRELMHVLRRPLIGSELAIFFIVNLAFSAIPVILPLLGISSFGLGTVEMAYFFVYIAVMQIVLQGFIIGHLVNRFGEEKLTVFGSFMTMTSMLFMALAPSIAILLVLVTVMILGSDVIQTIVPSFISKRTPPNDQGSILGVTQSVSSVARIPGPLIGGFASEFAGLAAPFMLSAGLLMVALFLGVKVHFEVESSLEPQP
nr:MFS transporter [Candidatus Njordarchaeum guaymaensis]